MILWAARYESQRPQNQVGFCNGPLCEEVKWMEKETHVVTQQEANQATIQEKIAGSSWFVYHSRSASWDAVQINIDESHNFHLTAAQKQL